MFPPKLGLFIPKSTAHKQQSFRLEGLDDDDRVVVDDDGGDDDRDVVYDQE